MTKAGHTFTAGPWETDNSWLLHGEARPDMMDYRCNVDAPVPFTENEHGDFERVETQTGAIAFGRTPEEAQANARLIAEAFTVAHETGLTPRQLAERCEKLEAMLKLALPIISDRTAGGRMLTPREHAIGVFQKIDIALSKAADGGAA